MVLLSKAPYVVYVAVVSIRRDNEATIAQVMFKLMAVLLLALKSAVNFIVYCWCSEKFRVTLGRLFRCQLLGQGSACCQQSAAADVTYSSVGMQTIAVHVGNESPAVTPGTQQQRIAN